MNDVCQTDRTRLTGRKVQNLSATAEGLAFGDWKLMQRRRGKVSLCCLLPGSETMEVVRL